MSLTSGQMLAHYRLVGKIGEGGMGVVWKAVDTTLDREVAIKLLPEAFAADRERLARSEREAKLLASLNHPNIAAVYGLHDAEGVRFLAMELVGGEDLARRMARGPVPVDEAIGIATQIADALEAAHDQGVVHRDLKPANVMLTPEGKAKVLDFGLAKTVDAAPGGDPSMSPTLTAAGTAAGMIMGTAAYMSPEQARGRPVDRRADLWAFGCVLYEMLAGARPFDGESITDVLAAVVKEDPDWDALPADLPAGVRRVVKRCLTKDAARRLRDAGDARIEIEEAVAGPAGAPAAVGPQGRRAGGRFGWILAALFAALAAGSLWWGGGTTAPTIPPRAFEVTLAEGARLPFDEWPVLALSPDGRTLVYVAVQDGVRRLSRRDLGRIGVEPIAGTEGAGGPFFSPDGRWVAFFADGKLKKVNVDGGTPITLCDAVNQRGGSWAPDGTILVATSVDTGLVRVPDGGGTPQPFTTPDPANNERTHRWPHVLPGGKHVLFTVGTLDSHGDYDDAKIGLASLETGEWQVVFEGARMAAFVAPDTLLALRRSTLLAAHLDPADPSPPTASSVVLEDVGGEGSSGAGYLAVARDGTAAYVPAALLPDEQTLVLVDRDGGVEPLPLRPQSYRSPRFSPDGGRLVFTIGVGRGARDEDVWIYDLEAGGPPRRLTFEGYSTSPIWSNDGADVAFTTAAPGKEGIWLKRADGAGPATQALSSAATYLPNFFTADDDALVLTRLGVGLDLWTAPLEGGREPAPLFADAVQGFAPSLSPDGRLVAYVSGEASSIEVFVRTFPDTGSKWQVSTEGGTSPVWSRDGRELYYLGPGETMTAVPVQIDPVFRAGEARALFSGPFETRTEPFTNYDVNAGGRFVMVRRSDREQVARRIHVLLNWDLSKEEDPR